MPSFGGIPLNAVIMLLVLLPKEHYSSPVESQLVERSSNKIKVFLGGGNVNKDSSCQLSGRMYLHGDHIANEDPCETCMCFRGDILCWSMECPPIAKSTGCTEVHVKDRCCPVYECPLSNSKPSPAKRQNATKSSFQQKRKKDCHLAGRHYPPGEIIPSATGPCLECRCGTEGSVICTPRECRRSSEDQLGPDIRSQERDKPVVNIYQPRLNEVRAARRRRL